MGVIPIPWALRGCHPLGCHLWGYYPWGCHLLGCHLWGCLSQQCLGQHWLSQQTWKTSDRGCERDAQQLNKDGCRAWWAVLECTSPQQSRNSSTKNEQGRFWVLRVGVERNTSGNFLLIFCCFEYYWSVLRAATKGEVRFLGSTNYQLSHAQAFTTACFGK